MSSSKRAETNGGGNKGSKSVSKDAERRKEATTGGIGSESAKSGGAGKPGEGEGRDGRCETSERESFAVVGAANSSKGEESGGVTEGERCCAAESAIGVVGGAAATAHTASILNLHYLDAAPLFLLIHALSLSRSRRTRAALHAFPSSLQALNFSQTFLPAPPHRLPHSKRSHLCVLCSSARLPP